MNKDLIIKEIVRTARANDGVPLGHARFETETGIKKSDWFGKFWAKWGDAIREAGFAPNTLNGAHDEDILLYKFAQLAVEIGRIPVSGDLRLKRRTDREFPSHSTFSRFGPKTELLKKVMDFCGTHENLASVVTLCDEYLNTTNIVENDQPYSIGFVYLIKHGARQEYKIGRTNNPLRREGEIGIELPEKITPIHVIETDDPVGIELYWHRRFADKRLKNEWFSLSKSDVQAFKRWRRIN